MKIQESAENYLEAIHVLTLQNGQVRSIDVAHYTGFSKPSISRAVGLLRDNGYVSIDQNGLLSLTEAGLKIAETIYERHTVLTDLLIKLGVSPDVNALATIIIGIVALGVLAATILQLRSRPKKARA